MLKEFKKFIMGGNVIEFAVAVIMAGAIGKVVNGFVNLIIMPIVGHFSGGADFSDKKIILDEAVVDAAGKITTPENAIMWGSWINTIMSLIIVGFVMFMMIKAYNNMKKKEEEAAPSGPSDNDLLKEILEALKK